MFINKVFMLLFILMIAPSIYAKQVYPGFVNPESAVQGQNGDIFVTEIGEFGKDGDGKIKKLIAKVRCLILQLD